jgi:Cu+-exporting ATPase
MTEMNAPTQTASFDVPIRGMTCAACVRRVEGAIRGAEGVAAASVNLATERAHVELAPGGGAGAVDAAIRAAGYEPAAQEVDLSVGEMMCAACVKRVEKALAAVPGALEVSVNLATHRAHVRGLGADRAQRLAAAATAAGYPTQPVENPAAQAERAAAARPHSINTPPYLLKATDGRLLRRVVRDVRARTRQMGRRVEP